MSEINKIIITGDFSRISNKKMEQKKNIEWLFNILKTPLEFSTDTEIKIFPSSLEEKIVDIILSEIGIMGIESWVSRYNLDITSNYVLNILNEVFSQSLVICLEIPYWLEKALEKIDCIVLEVIFHPVRFMPDLLLGFASKNKKIDNILKEFSVPIFNMYSEACLIKSYNQRLENSGYFKESENFLLITGQMDVDRSIICNYHLKTIYDYENELIEYAKTYNDVIYKPHPYMLKDSVKMENIKNQVMFLKSIFKNVRVTNIDFYWLISQNEIKKTLSLSSSTGIEARFFGISSDFLYKYQWSVDTQVTEDKFFYPINQSFLYPDFWGRILSPFMDTSINRFDKNYQKNRIRKTIIQSWGFSLTDFGAEERLFNIDKKNKKNSDQQAINLVRKLDIVSKEFSKLDIEFNKNANDKSTMTIFLTSILNNLEKENKLFLLQKLLNLTSMREAEDIIHQFTDQEVVKLLESIGKFACLNRLDINIVIAKLGRKI